MSQADFGKICQKLRSKLTTAFIERIERRLGQDFEDSLAEKPRELLVNILQDLHLYYIVPFEIVLELSEYLKKTFDISEFSLSLSPEYDFQISKKTKEAFGIVQAFYDMVSSLGFEQMFAKNVGRWWENEF
jgi:hypothetical protein